MTRMDTFGQSSIFIIYVKALTPVPQDVTVWTWAFEEVINLRLVGWALIQFDLCLKKRRYRKIPGVLVHRGTTYLRRQQDDRHLLVDERGLEQTIPLWPTEETASPAP